MQTPRQKAIAAARARGQAKIAAGRKKYNSLTPLQRASMAQRQRARAKATTGNLTSAQSARKAQMLAQAKALGTKQMQATNKATPTRRKPTGRTLYKSRTTIPTRRRRK